MRRSDICAAFAALLFLAGCDAQMDLYDTALPMLAIEGDWKVSLEKAEMLDATAMLYGDGRVKKAYLSRYNAVTAAVSRGRYDILLFNGVMESEEDTNLNHVFFRGTHRPETFEAVASEGTRNRRLYRAGDEYAASNEMEIFTFARGSTLIEEDDQDYLKYRNGRKVAYVPENYVACEVSLVPRAMSYRFQIKLTNLVNPSSARVVSGALRGFAGSVFPAAPDMPRTGMSATHFLNLAASSDGIRTDGDGFELGAVLSPVFVSFGPPLPDNPDALPLSGRYTFEPSFLLTDNSEFKLPQPFDITPQVNEAIRRIYLHQSGGGDISLDDNFFMIEITDRIELPVITPGQVVDVAGWEDDEEVLVWI